MSDRVNREKQAMMLKTILPSLPRAAITNCFYHATKLLVSILHSDVCSIDVKRFYSFFFIFVTFFTFQNVFNFLKVF